MNVLHVKVLEKAYEILERNPEAEWPALKLAFQESLVISILKAKQDNCSTVYFANEIANLLMQLNLVCANLNGPANAAHMRALNERIA